MRLHVRLGLAKGLVSGLLLCAVVLVASPLSRAATGDEKSGFLLAQAGAGGQSPASGQWGGRMSAEQDLVWLLAGIMDMERDRKLALTRDQATLIWPLFNSLVEKGLIRLEVDPAQFETAVRPGWQGQTGQEPVRRDDARMQEVRKQREAREEATRQAIEQMEKVLSPKQIAYVDNFDFDPEKHGLAPRAGGMRPPAGQGANQGTAPSQQEMKRLMEEAKANAQRLADFYKNFQAFIKKKAGIKP